MMKFTKIRNSAQPFYTDRQSLSQDEVNESIVSTLQNNPLFNGKLITGIPTASGALTEGIPITASKETIIYHGLGRRCKGWIITRYYYIISFGTTIYEFSPPSDNETLSLSSTVDATIELWVF